MLMLMKALGLRQHASCFSVPEKLVCDLVVVYVSRTEYFDHAVSKSNEMLAGVNNNVIV
jgi:hypothetical protein